MKKEYDWETEWSDLIVRSDCKLRKASFFLVYSVVKAPSLDIQRADMRLFKLRLRSENYFLACLWRKEQENIRNLDAIIVMMLNIHF